MPIVHIKCSLKKYPHPFKKIETIFYFLHIKNALTRQEIRNNISCTSKKKYPPSLRKLRNYFLHVEKYLHLSRKLKKYFLHIKKYSHMSRKSKQNFLHVKKYPHPSRKSKRYFLPIKKYPRLSRKSKQYFSHFYF
jgi:hypothetical protein